MESPLEIEFLKLWKTLFPEIILLREKILIPTRKFRVDFFEQETRSVIEIQGFHNGSHNKGKALTKEYLKYNTLQLRGYKVFLLSKEMINRDYLIEIGRYILSHKS